MNSLLLQDTLEDDIKEAAFPNRHDLSKVLEINEIISLIL